MVTVPDPTTSWLTMEEIRAAFTETGTVDTIIDEFGNQNPRFDGATNGFDLGSAVFTSGAQHSISFRTRFPTAGGNEFCVSQYKSFTTIDRQFALSKEADNDMFTAGYDGAGNTYFLDGTIDTFATTTWYEHVITFNANAIKHYVDGVDKTVFLSQGGAGWLDMANGPSNFVLGADADGGQFGEVDIARVQAWVGTELSAVQVAQFHTNEEAKKGLVPTPTDEWRTKAQYDVDYTPEGGIGTVTDQFGNIVYGNTDGANDALGLTAGPYFNITNTVDMISYTLAFWFKLSSAFNGKAIFTQSDGAADVFTVRQSSSGKFICERSDDGTNKVQIFTSAGLDDSENHYFHLVYDHSKSGDELKVAIDGVDDTDSSFSIGSLAVWPATFGNAFIFRSDFGSFSINLEQSVHKIWIGKAFNAEQKLNDYLNELSLLSLKNPQGGIGRQAGRFDMLEQHMWNRGLERFKRS